MKESKECLSRLQLCGMEKVNFSGGEPFLQAKELGELVRFCKVELKVSVSIVSNGSLINRSWMKQYGKFLDIIAISCDSFNEETNMKIGRGKGAHINQLYQIKEWCHEFEVGFKINMSSMHTTCMRTCPKPCTLAAHAMEGFSVLVDRRRECW